MVGYWTYNYLHKTVKEKTVDLERSIVKGSPKQISRNDLQLALPLGGEDILPPTPEPLQLLNIL